MKLQRHASATAFLACAESWLLAAEPENNLILGIAHQFVSDPARYGASPYFASISDGESVRGAAFRTPPYHLGLTELPLDAVPLLIEDISEVYTELPGLVGPPECAREFAEHWVARHGGAWSVRARLCVHALRRVEQPPSPPSGLLRPAGGGDVEIANTWAAEFVRETGIANSPREFGALLIDSGRLYLWDDNGPKCMLASTRETPHGACVNAVYTPPRYRGLGYASSAVARLSQQFLDAGYEFCCLYTDQANPVSNAIYRRVGYVPVRDCIEIALSD